MLAFIPVSLLQDLTCGMRLDTLALASTGEGAQLRVEAGREVTSGLFGEIEPTHAERCHHHSQYT